MNFRMNATKINGDKLLTIVVALVIIIYIAIMMLKEFDFSDIKNVFSNVSSELSISEVVDYVDNHPNYYYKIDGAAYCISKEELINSNEISDKFIEKMQTSFVKVEYINNNFTFMLTDLCEEG